MDTVAVVLEGPERPALARLDLTPAGDDDVVVDVEWSGISTGTERLLWSGRMPPFPGMGYPLVPGYESVGRVAAGRRQFRSRRVGERVFVPGARCFGEVRGLFGGAAASRWSSPGARVVPIDDGLGEQRRAAGARRDRLPRHRRLGAAQPRAHRRPRRARPAAGPAGGRWPARAAHGLGDATPTRRGGAVGYRVIDPAERRRGATTAPSATSAATPRILDTPDRPPRARAARSCWPASTPSRSPSPSRPPSCARRASASPREWRDARPGRRAGADRRRPPVAGRPDHPRAEARARPDAAYRTAFGDPACLKMILDWRACP